MVKKRMSCLMGCQECNSIIMKSDSGELAGWMDGWMAAEGGGRLVQSYCLNVLNILKRQKQVSRFLTPSQSLLVKNSQIQTVCDLHYYQNMIFIL